jgi:predicted CXXCH cytochrome family protein
MAYNRAETSTQTVVAYGSGMSEWCQNCHTNVHLDGYVTGRQGLRHPAGDGAPLHAGQYDVYNAYVPSGDMSGTANTAYNSLVPFEQGKGTTLATLKNQAAGGENILAGPTSNVMCLSCHRAHASAFDNMVRWDQQATFLTNGTGFTEGITTGATPRSTQQTTAGYYDRPATVGATALGPYQRSLCNKCHGKD